MTSQLNVDTIVDKAGSGGTNVKVANTSTYVSEGGNVTQNTVQSLAKHIHYFNQATLTLNSSLNTSSITDVGTGMYDPQLTNSMSSTNYSVFAHSSAENNNANFSYYGYNRVTGSYRRYNYDNASRDMIATDGMLLGDLA
jgi:hypothetical protein